MIEYGKWYAGTNSDGEGWCVGPHDTAEDAIAEVMYGDDVLREDVYVAQSKEPTFRTDALGELAIERLRDNIFDGTWSHDGPWDEWPNVADEHLRVLDAKLKKVVDSWIEEYAPPDWYELDVIVRATEMGEEAS